jgi:Uma2 family endonuclease
LVPDLCVEIVSPSENYTDVNAKVALYFEDGVKIVWIIDPQQRTIAIYERGSDQFTLLGQDRTLSGGDVLPGFEIALADIFED